MVKLTCLSMDCYCTVTALLCSSCCEQPLGPTVTVCAPAAIQVQYLLRRLDGE